MCRRCRADLALCFAVESQREHALAAARAAAADGRARDALAFSESALALRGGSDADQLLAALHLLVEDFASAWAYYLATVSSERERLQLPDCRI
jgi:hypothetical protein